MEGQGKRLLVAVALALGVLLLWNMIFPSEDKPQTPTTGSQAAVTKVVAKPRVCEFGNAEQPKLEDPTLTTFDFPGKFRATFSTRNGSLQSWRLLDPRYEKDTTKGELLPNRPDAGSFAIAYWRGSDVCFPQQTNWTLERKTDTELVYSWPSKGSPYESLGIQFKKTFKIEPDVYSVHMTLEESVPSGKRRELAVTSFAYQDPAADTEGSMQVQPRVWQSSTLRDGEIVHTPLQELEIDPAEPKHGPRAEQKIVWTGYEHPYLLAAYAPKAPNLYRKSTLADESVNGLMRTDIRYDTQTGDKSVYEMIAYLGPKNYTQLENADAEAEKLGFDPQFKATVDLGWFAFIGRPLMWLLFQFQSVVVNWGVAIMLLTVLVKLLTLYWTTKSMRSMKAMAALAPQMKALQEKYANDRARIQAETMALYKQHNVNPIAGCLPILLQMPVWIALYRMLSSAGELFQQPFISGWIDDLTNRDPTHILPIILVVTMFFQARLSPSGGDSRQQKMMQYGLPLMFGVMSFFFPAGLTLYIFTNTCLSALHSIYMNKYDKKSLEIMARMKANAEAAKAAAAKPAGGAKKSEVAAKPAKKPVIDADSIEKSEDSEDNEDSASAAESPARPRPNQQRKKKRRR
jgi:YidC/Oxa1 family membrane protein insertase